MTNIKTDSVYCMLQRQILLGLARHILKLRKNLISKNYKHDGLYDV